MTTLLSGAETDPRPPAESRRPRRPRAGRAARILLAAVGGLVAAVLVPSVAFAGNGPWSQNKYSACTSVISTYPTTGYGVAHLDYDAYRATTRNYIIEHSYASASFYDCGQHGAGVRPYQTTVQLKFQFNGTALSCTGGVDAGFPRNVGVSYSCSGSGSTVTETLSSTCYNQYSCSTATGYLSVIVPSGSSFSNYVLAQTRVTVVSSSGNSYTWSTDWI